MNGKSIRTVIQANNWLNYAVSLDSGIIPLHMLKEISKG